MGFFLTLIKALIFVITTLVDVYIFVVIGACLISWVSADPYNPIVRVLRNLTDPVLWRIRKYLPFVVIGGLDLSPIALILVLKVAEMLVTDLLLRLALTLVG